MSPVLTGSSPPQPLAAENVKNRHGKKAGDCRHEESVQHVLVSFLPHRCRLIRHDVPLVRSSRRAFSAPQFSEAHGRGFSRLVPDGAGEHAALPERSGPWRDCTCRRVTITHASCADDAHAPGTALHAEETDSSLRVTSGWTSWEVRPGCVACGSLRARMEQTHSA